MALDAVMYDTDDGDIWGAHWLLTNDSEKNPKAKEWIESGMVEINRIRQFSIGIVDHLANFEKLKEEWCPNLDFTNHANPAFLGPY